MPTSTDTPKLRWWQRWLRLSLRMFLLLLTFSCLWLGWIANRANQQRKAVQWVKNVGLVLYDYDRDEEGRFYEPSEPPVPDWLVNLIGIDYFANVVFVRIEDAQVSDVTPLVNLPKLEILWFWESQLTDVTPLAKLTNLVELDLEDTLVRDVTPLTNLKNLEWLRLSTQVRDVAPLANLKNLQHLDLSCSQVSDVTPLANLTNLEFLDLFDTPVSKENCEMLQKSLPSLEIQGP